MEAHTPGIHIYITNEFTKGTLIHSCAHTIHTVILMQTLHTHTHIRAHLITLMRMHNSHTVIHMHTIHTHKSTQLHTDSPQNI